MVRSVAKSEPIKMPTTFWGWALATIGWVAAVFVLIVLPALWPPAVLIWAVLIGAVILRWVFGLSFWK